jgi:peptidoglycan/LPS O-acetylase OafA/YrhL
MSSEPFPDAHVLEPEVHRVAALDGLRAIAVLLVMASHFERFIAPAAWIMPLKIFMSYGWTGVDLFFALSGFLITGILLATRTDRHYLTTFYARRAIRIFPIYYTTLIFVLLFVTLLPSFSDRVPPKSQWPLYFVFATNWIPVFSGVWPPNVIGHFWSLAVEEQYYLVWPFVILLLARRTVATVAVSLAFAALVARCIVVIGHGPSVAVDLSTFTRCDSLALGSLGAIYYAKRRNEAGLKLGQIATLSIGLFIVILISLRTESIKIEFWQTAGFSLLAIGFGALVTHLAFTDGKATLSQRILQAKSMRTIGRYSYGMYVYHVPVLGLCEVLLLHRLPPELQRNVAFDIVYILFLAAFTFAVASLSYEIFERKVLVLKNRFVSSSRNRDSSPLAAK